jgi:hypothetical protein
VLTTWIVKPESIYNIFKGVNNRDSWHTRYMRFLSFQVISHTLCNLSLYALNFPYCRRNMYLDYHNTFLAHYSHALTVGHDCINGHFLNISNHVNTLWILSFSWTHMVRSFFTNQLSICVPQDKIPYFRRENLKWNRPRMTQNLNL